MLTTAQKNTIKKVVSKFNPKLVGIFGSYARNEQQRESDLDILVDFNDSVNLIELIGLEQELTELLGIKVDLVTLKSVNPSLNDYIQKDLIRIV
jgi:predicted nucleotidyltransferase